MPKNKRIWHYFLIFLFLILLVLSFPFELVMAPERKFQITDSMGNPINDAAVRQIWYQYALGVRREIDLRPNLKGQVFLPRRAVRTNLMALIFGGINEFKDLGIHASVGSSESIGIFVSGLQDKWIHDGEGLEGGTVVMGSEK